MYSEFKEFFPENNVEYFVSYYDYYQPESYIPASDTYIEKDSSVNDEIDKLRHSATLSLFETRDVIIVASVSCIYGLGDPIDYQGMMLSLRPGMQKQRNDVLKKLISMQYTRNEIDFKRGTFRARNIPIRSIRISSKSRILGRWNRKNIRNKSINRKSYRNKKTYINITRFSLCYYKGQNGTSNSNNRRRNERKSRIF